MNVLITPRGFANYGLDQIAQMEAKGLQVHYNDTGNAYSEETFLTLAKEADAIIVGVDRLDQEVMAQCPRLKAICKFGVGTDNIDLDYAKERGIAVGRTMGTNSNAVAEHVMAFIYSEAKNIYQTIHEVKNQQWIKPTGREILGKTLGIIGFGAIGKQLARQAVGVGMEVLVYDVQPIAADVLEAAGVTEVSFDEVIAQADYLSLHLPLLPETENLIAADVFKQMKPQACLINSARGGIVNEEELAQALQQGLIRSACFDVFSTEPPPANHPLVQLNNFFLTPHIGARTMEAETRTCQLSTKIIMEELQVL